MAHGGVGWRPDEGPVPGGATHPRRVRVESARGHDHTRTGAMGGRKGIDTCVHRATVLCRCAHPHADDAISTALETPPDHRPRPRATSPTGIPHRSLVPHPDTRVRRRGIDRLQPSIRPVYGPRSSAGPRRGPPRPRDGEAAVQPDRPHPLAHEAHRPSPPRSTRPSTTASVYPQLWNFLWTTRDPERWPYEDRPTLQQQRLTYPIRTGEVRSEREYRVDAGSRCAVG